MLSAKNHASVEHTIMPMESVGNFGSNHLVSTELTTQCRVLVGSARALAPPALPLTTVEQRTTVQHAP